MKMVFKGIGAIVFGVAALILMQGKNVKAGDPGPTATPTVTPTPIAVSVGEGNLDFQAILKTLRTNNTTEYALVEQDECYGASPFDCLRRSYEYLQRVMAQ